MATSLQTLRIAKGLSLTDLAQQASVSVSYVSKIESGIFPLTSTLIGRLCPLLGCTRDDLANDHASAQYSFQEQDVTFKNNRLLSIHKWYPYIEGFSESFVKSILEKHNDSIVVYDPFNGSGTTMLTAAYAGYKVVASEINPFMRFVANVKVNTVKTIIASNDKLSKLLTAQASFSAYSDVNYENVPILSHINECYIDDGFFESVALTKIAFIKSLIGDEKDKDVKDILYLCLASIIVEVSTMIRAADLRKRTISEQNGCADRVIALFLERLSTIVSDITAIKNATIAEAMIISDNAKTSMPDMYNSIDVIITSPPYINGTNYFRNTKLELWILDFITKRDELRNYRSKAITAGINNVSKDIGTVRTFPFVEEYATILDRVSPDKRIPMMIRAYFSDMSIVFTNFYHLLKNDGRLYFDIGDSEYYGIHIPVDDIIEQIAEQCGLILRESLVTRNRKSKKGTTLNQKLLVFEKSKTAPTMETMSMFGLTLPYKHDEFAKRNWGSSMHSLCSYQGKLKPAIAYHLIKNFTQQGDIVLDPFCGIGTIPIEACLNGRIGIGVDINPIAYANTLAKVKTLQKSRIAAEINKLESFIKNNIPSDNEVAKADCKLPINNGRISEYYHIDTLKEIISARQYFLNIAKDSAEQQFLLACMLHILHGNRPYALSKCSNNQTPLKPREDEIAVYKNVAHKVQEKAERMYKSLKYSDVFTEGDAYLSSLFNVSITPYTIDTIITSPPFASSTRFYSSNWLRLWFCGWETTDFNMKKEKFIDYQQEREFDTVYGKILNSFFAALKPQGLTIMHLGKTDKIDMSQRISSLIVQDARFELLGFIEESVADCNKHGLKDQGATTDHQFLFFRKR